MLDKTQKTSSRILSTRRLKDIKNEVGEDTRALLKNIKATEKRLPKREQTLKQISLIEQQHEFIVDVTEPKPVPESKVIYVKTLPPMESMIEVRDMRELNKVAESCGFINCFEDDKQLIYFSAGYFYRTEKRK